MKRILLASIAALALAGAASAQNTAPAPSKNPPPTVSISGNLELVRGVIGLKANGTSYLVPRLRQLVGFIKEIQEGAAVKLEGYAYPIPSEQGYAFFMPTKLSVAGKDYDLGQGGPGGPFGGKGRRGRGMMRGEGWEGMMGEGPRW